LETDKMSATIPTGSAIVARLVKTARAIDERIAILESIDRSAVGNEAWRFKAVDPFLPTIDGLMPESRRDCVDILRTARKAIDEYIQIASSPEGHLRAAFLLGMAAAWVHLALVGKDEIQTQRHRVLKAIDDFSHLKAAYPPDDRWRLERQDPLLAPSTLVGPARVLPDEALSEYLAILDEEERCLRQVP
jgi:hypothetical protein